MNAELFVEELSNLSFKNVFNPYSDCCALHDIHDAPEKRRMMLKKMLIAASKVEIDSIWIGRDLGYRGGRRTGLALTDDVHLSYHAARWGIEFSRLTKGETIAERTAAVIWDVLQKISQPIFLWNVFPLHPYEDGDPFSNRAHNAKERAVGEELLNLIVKLLKPKRLIAIGNDAEKAALRLQSQYVIQKVRHPSYGGQNIFLDQLNAIYKLHKVGGINNTQLSFC